MSKRVLSKEDLEFKYSWKDLVKSIWFLLDLGGVRKRYILYLILLSIILIYTIVPPLIVGSIVDFFTKYKPGQSFGRFYFLTFLLGSSMLVVSLIRLTIKQKMGLLLNKSNYEIKVKGFELLLSQSLIENSKTATGEKMQKIQNGIDSLSVFSSLLNNSILYALSSFVGMISILMFVNYTYAIFFAIYTIIFYIILKIFTNRLNKLNFARYDAMEKAGGVYVEGLNNISTLKSLGSEKHFQTRIIERENISKIFLDKLLKTGNNQWRVFQVFNGLSAGAFLFLIGRDVLFSVISIGQIVIFYSYFDKMTSFAGDIMDIYGNLIQARAGIGRMMNIFKEKTVKSKGHSCFPKTWRKLSMSNASFFYKSDLGIKNVNISVRRGEKIGIVGKTGSGKSTLSKLLLGLYSLKKGEYRIDETNFYSIKTSEVFENMSIVPQEIEMFNMSFVENITLFRKVDPSLLDKAIEISHLQEVIDTLPNGLDTIIGEKGYRLSGGERQRLAIARAICKNSQILILDEATSSLDSKTEKDIFDSIEKNFPDLTIIAIAHRVKTLENADKIYVFEKGEIVEEGKYGKLINDENSYLYSINKIGLKN